MAADNGQAARDAAHAATVEELARRLAAAAISVQLGTALEYTYRQYKRVAVGDYWRSIAAHILANPPGA